MNQLSETIIIFKFHNCNPDRDRDRDPDPDRDHDHDHDRDCDRDPDPDPDRAHGRDQYNFRVGFIINNLFKLFYDTE